MYQMEIQSSNPFLLLSFNDNLNIIFDRKSRGRINTLRLTFSFYTYDAHSDIFFSLSFTSHLMEDLSIRSLLVCVSTVQSFPE